MNDQWVEFAIRIQSIAQAGLQYGKDQSVASNAEKKGRKHHEYYLCRGKRYRRHRCGGGSVLPTCGSGNGKGICGKSHILRQPFLALYEEGKLIAFVDGFVTDEPDLTDEMYAHASMHNENGAWAR